MAVSLRQDDRLSTQISSNSSSGKRKRIVLEEDEFISAIDAIIERDFFPDLQRMKKQLNSHETSFIYAQDNRRPMNAILTPSTFETPSIHQSTKCHDEESEIHERSVEDQVIDQGIKKPRTDLSLNAFLAKYTSEDDASFDEIMKEAERRHKAKYPWLYKDETVMDNLALPSTEEQQALTRNKIEALTWPYKNRNSLMFVPEESPLLTEKDFGKSRLPTIVHENTRFTKHPFNEQLNEAALAEATLMNSKEREGRIGIDGKELVSGGPRVGGYGFVSMTPSPMPGVNSTPLMTWGQIEGTPCPLEGGETPLISSSPRTPHFRIPDVPERDRIAHNLVDKISKNNRERKKEAIKQAQYFRSSPSVNSGRNMNDSLGSMSPAAQRLVTTKLGINKCTDLKLRESYSPRINKNLDKYEHSSSQASAGNFKSSTLVNNDAKSSGLSLTDNLLNIPRKR